MKFNLFAKNGKHEQTISTSTSILPSNGNPLRPNRWFTGNNSKNKGSKYINLFLFFINVFMTFI